MSLLQPVARPSPLRGDVQPHPGRKLSEQEFLDWIGHKTRAEWVDGEVVMMAADSFDHAGYGWWLLSAVKLFVDDRRLGDVIRPQYSRPAAASAAAEDAGRLLRCDGRRIESWLRSY